jgi:hypothetical protein
MAIKLDGLAEAATVSPPAKEFDVRRRQADG